MIPKEQSWPVDEDNPKPMRHLRLPIVLFGIDEHGKPKAARFGNTEAKLATKAADQLRLKVVTIASPTLAEIAAQLPAGRIHARGCGVVPHVRADLYAKLVSAAAADGATNGPPAETPAKPHPAVPLRAATAAVVDQGTGTRLHRAIWSLAHESPEDGWYDAVVVGRTGDMCTLRWRDYPRVRTFTRHRRTLALRCADPEAVSAVIGPSHGEKPTKPTAKPTAAAQSKSAAQGLPTTWADINVGHLVLAMCDGPWESWWEAIPTENHGATLTLRWLDYGQLTNVDRARVSLALLCPTAA